MESNRRKRDDFYVLSAVWVGLVLFVVAIGWVLTHPLESSVDPWDDDVVVWLADHRTATMDPVADIGSKVADTVVGLALATVIAVIVSRRLRTWRPAAYYGALIAPILGLYLIVTALVPRDRPPVKILDPGLVPDHSFPSGHVATAILVYGGTALLIAAYKPAWKSWAWLLFLVPFIVAPSRLYQGAHHPTDVLASFVFAPIWLAVVAKVLLPPATRWSRRDEVPSRDQGSRRT